MIYECGDELKNAIGEQLGRFAIRTSSQANLRSAAVAITIVDVGMGADIPGIDVPHSWSNEAALLLTRRSEKLRNHRGNGHFQAVGSRLARRSTKRHCVKCTRKWV